jgi:hypothetical protein
MGFSNRSHAAQVPNQEIVHPFEIKWRIKLVLCIYFFVAPCFLKHCIRLPSFFPHITKFVRYLLCSGVPSYLEAGLLLVDIHCRRPPPASESFTSLANDACASLFNNLHRCRNINTRDTIPNAIVNETVKRPLYLAHIVGRVFN